MDMVTKTEKKNVALKVAIVTSSLAVAIVFLQMPIFRTSDGTALLSRVVSPSSDEVFAHGDAMEIRWEGGDVNDPVTLTITDESGTQLIRTLVVASENDGIERWFVDMPPGRYKIVVQFCPDCNEGSSWVASPRPFTIRDGTLVELPLFVF